MENRTKIQWVLVAFVVITTAATASDLIAYQPWGKFLSGIIAGLYAWGALKKPTVSVNGTKVVLPFLLVLGTAACSVSEVHLKSDIDHYKAIAPYYVEYVTKDPDLSNAQKGRRIRTVATWKLSIEKAGGKIEEPDQ